MAATLPAAVPIRPAATIVIARDGAPGLELLMVRRSRSAVFLAGAHVFPGGRVDECDSTDLAADAVLWSGDPVELPWRAAALRELFEETGVVLGSSARVDARARDEAVYRELVTAGGRFDADRLEYFANWVTPVGPPRRFDTRFYLAVADVDPTTDDHEVFDPVWVAPSAALELADSGRWFMEVPTRATVELAAEHDTARSLQATAAAVSVEKIEPRVVVAEDGSISVLLPGDVGFDEAPA